ncbi:progranulin isoform X2 [Hemicordylus capensis]|uniref:progranulin isoform X2 n=1 Tax=Hemicordylus capensis TaxID=884348 RepID=UPI002303BFD8|nr:progranulin isoform X2 [Hemicordylus capensis]
MQFSAMLLTLAGQKQPIRMRQEERLDLSQRGGRGVCLVFCLLLRVEETGIERFAAAALLGDKSKGVLAKMWVQVLMCLVLGGTASSLQCPDGRRCEGPSTCCKLPGQDGYSCCDQPQFTGASLQLLFPDNVNEASSTECPDGSVCPAEYSCLRTPDAAFACCPWSEAISCADGRHCCPRGSHCSADGHSCFQSQVLASPVRLGAVQCPDGESECPNESTCCLMADGNWGCCPMPEAACCADKIHCCPHDATCDLKRARCLVASGEQPLGTKFPARKQALELALPQKTCPDLQSACPDTATCCTLTTGKYGCCPLQNAVCCSDHIHCCPQGTSCDMVHSRCATTAHWSWPMTRLPVDVRTVHDVQCSTEDRCLDGNTCCQKPSGAWGCCPWEEAVCCSDGIHCCPKGYQCDIAEGKCVMGSKNILWLAKMDQNSAVTSAGKEAVCCPDHIHCCPSGYHCDPSQGCLMNGDRIPWLEKKPAIASITSLNRNVRCDSHFSCADGQTCCRMNTGAWACCPHLQAVCCSDGVHCCPHGYTCDIKTGSCDPSALSSPWISKASNLARVARDVKCDDTMSCQDEETCCRLPSGSWGCCPYPQAVCCSDGVHCCPHGYTCDISTGRCDPSALSSPWISMASNLARLDRDVKCDDTMSCRDGETCCQMPSGSWGCCPLSEAVCCSDHLHCCPKGYSCDPAHPGICHTTQHSLPWAPKLPARTRQYRGVRCNDTASCEEGQTCCKDASGSWACCQLPNAVCCEDHQHCCPSSYTCNVAAQTCEKQQQPRPLAAGGWLSSVPLLSSSSAMSGQDVQCDVQHYCHDGQSCCQTSSGGWACCPYSKGSCCSDKRHCCPPGFRCSRSGYECVKKGPLRWDTNVFSHHSPRARPLL